MRFAFVLLSLVLVSQFVATAPVPVERWAGPRVSGRTFASKRSLDHDGLQGEEAPVRPRTSERRGVGPARLRRRHDDADEEKGLTRLEKRILPYLPSQPVPNKGAYMAEVLGKLGIPYSALDSHGQTERSAQHLGSTYPLKSFEMTSPAWYRGRMFLKAVKYGLFALLTLLGVGAGIAGVHELTENGGKHAFHTDPALQHTNDSVAFEMAGQDASSVLGPARSQQSYVPAQMTLSSAPASGKLYKRGLMDMVRSALSSTEKTERTIAVVADGGAAESGSPEVLRSQTGTVHVVDDKPNIAASSLLEDQHRGSTRASGTADAAAHTTSTAADTPVHPTVQHPAPVEDGEKASRRVRLWSKLKRHKAIVTGAVLGVIAGIFAGLSLHFAEEWHKNRNDGKLHKRQFDPARFLHQGEESVRKFNDAGDWDRWASAYQPHLQRQDDHRPLAPRVYDGRQRGRHDSLYGYEDPYRTRSGIWWTKEIAFDVTIISLMVGFFVYSQHKNNEHHAEWMQLEKEHDQQLATPSPSSSWVKLSKRAMPSVSMEGVKSVFSKFNPMNLLSRKPAPDAMPTESRSSSFFGNFKQALGKYWGSPSGSQRTEELPRSPSFQQGTTAETEVLNKKPWYRKKWVYGGSAVVGVTGAALLVTGYLKQRGAAGSKPQTSGGSGAQGQQAVASRATSGATFGSSYSTSPWGTTAGTAGAHVPSTGASTSPWLSRRSEPDSDPITTDEIEDEQKELDEKLEQIEKKQDELDKKMSQIEEKEKEEAKKSAELEKKEKELDKKEKEVEEKVKKADEAKKKEEEEEEEKKEEEEEKKKEEEEEKKKKEEEEKKKEAEEKKKKKEEEEKKEKRGEEESKPQGLPGFGDNPLEHGHGPQLYPNSQGGFALNINKANDGDHQNDQDGKIHVVHRFPATVEVRPFSQEGNQDEHRGDSTSVGTVVTHPSSASTNNKATTDDTTTTTTTSSSQPLEKRAVITTADPSSGHTIEKRAGWFKIGFIAAVLTGAYFAAKHLYRGMNYQAGEKRINAPNSAINSTNVQSTFDRLGLRYDPATHGLYRPDGSRVGNEANEPQRQQRSTDTMPMGGATMPMGGVAMPMGAPAAR